jgi:hypothetical protein
LDDVENNIFEAKGPPRSAWVAPAESAVSRRKKEAAFEEGPLMAAHWNAKCGLQFYLLAECRLLTVGEDSPSPVETQLYTVTEPLLPGWRICSDRSLESI